VVHALDAPLVVPTSQNLPKFEEEEPTLAEIPPVEETPKYSPFCSCIHTARLYGQSIPLGTNAWDLTPSTTPQVGGLILFDYDPAHVGVILEFQEEGFLIVEGNRTACEKEIRVVSYDDRFISGFASF